ncbi:dioxygenase [Janibacter hoylei PVAS-1]|nr:class III extradiol ring-cleavage dioxygenase [Janibacter hoylei]RWU82269.1 dioxygenase [Janibacter hoylei PVAS-1]
MTSTPPVLFLSHGAPPLADDARWTAELARWSAEIERPKDILMVSAHWEDAPVTVSPSQRKVPLTYDFRGFPERYYRVQYDAPLAPDLADEVSALLKPKGVDVQRDETRGLDHGAYVPLVEMYPDADVPVLQMSMPTLDPHELLELGRALAPLRDQGTLIVGSGFTTHNLRWFNPRAGADSTPPTASSEFDHWAAETVAAGDVDSLARMFELAPAGHEAHPRTEHWAPLYIAMGAAEASGASERRTTVEGFWYGLSKRSWQFS